MGQFVMIFLDSEQNIEVCESIIQKQSETKTFLLTQARKIRGMQFSDIFFDRMSPVHAVSGPRGGGDKHTDRRTLQLID